jgi:2,3-bisphosphoglycerate-independent phosphoglycerate mutase
MKHIIILGDGMADEPIEQFGWKTPLEAAETPTIDALAKRGKLGLLNTTPKGYEPGSEVAHLSLLGYDVPSVFEGRGSLEAASMGVEILPGEMVMRCNLICIENGIIKNHSAGNITDGEAKELIDFLNEKLGNEKVQFYAGVSYRHLLKIRGGDKHISCTPPHDVPGTPFKDVMVKADTKEAEATAALINELILKSQEILPNHPVNIKRKSEGKDMASSIWPWSAGYKPAMDTLGAKYGIKNGAVISAVDLIRGIGVLAGLTPIRVEGVTGLYNTNYEGKAQAAIDALKGDYDFVFLHVEASDEAGHEGDYELKKTTIEYLDRRICKPIVEAIEKMDEEVTIAVLPDHPTPCRLRTHSASAVPFLICKPGEKTDGVTTYSEASARDGSYGTLRRDEFMKALFE